MRKVLIGRTWASFNISDNTPDLEAITVYKEGQALACHIDDFMEHMERWYDSPIQKQNNISWFVVNSDNFYRLIAMLEARKLCNIPPS